MWLIESVSELGAQPKGGGGGGCGMQLLSKSKFTRHRFCRYGDIKVFR